MWSLIHIPGWALFLVVILAIIGLKNLIGGDSGQEYKTELTEVGKVALTILVALGIMFALALVILLIVVIQQGVR
jgi:hypothetical protein